VGSFVYVEGLSLVLSRIMISNRPLTLTDPRYLIKLQRLNPTHQGGGYEGEKQCYLM